jgi:acylpyruvate hydrolase
MRLTMFTNGGPARLGVQLSNNQLLDLHGAAQLLSRISQEPEDAALPALIPNDSRRLLENGPVALDAARKVESWAEQHVLHGTLPTGAFGEELISDMRSTHICAPVLSPSKVIGIGLNYRSHAEEQNARLPKVPLIFAKWNNTLVGAYDDVVLPSCSQEVDFEVELAVVIGRRAKKISRDVALDYVAGYTALNDVTARDVQLADRQWVRGKTPDTLCPVGPFLVTPEEVPDVEALNLKLWVNDELMQDGNTSAMIFDVPELVSFLSHSFTLEPGDIIATGTPSGVGFKREPPLFLKPGDVVRIEVDGVGELVNKVVAEADNPLALAQQAARIYRP